VIVDVQVNGRGRAVDVRRRNDRFLVTLDGREHTVDVNQTGDIWSLLVGTASHEVAFVERPDGAMMVHVDGQAFPVSIAAPSSPADDRAGRRHGNRRSAAFSAAPAGGPERVAAPMPGKIVKVLVSVGDRVAPRQALIVIEAMKMENELRAQKAGTVSEIRVNEGASVEAGAILIVVE
jgi:biotin carboxyl carrier protein